MGDNKDKKRQDNGTTVDVDVIGISVCPPYQGYVVILKEHGGERWLPIFIGAAEAQAISLLLQGMEYARPLTYDLFENILMAGGIKIAQITVTELKDNTYYALVHMEDLKGEQKKIDARPSDAIALALKTKARIKVAKQVMDSASITGEPISKTDVDLVAQLNQRLKEAIEIEAYEEAAKIRDQIRALESKIGMNKRESKKKDKPV
jgi:bifunctional DNase/RNase